MILCLDLGNTHLHWGILNAGNVVKSGSLTIDTLTECFASIKTAKYPIRGISWCSVVPSKNEDLTAKINQAFPGIPVTGLHYKNNLGISIHYPNPQEIGQDRLANALAATQLYGAPCIIIDMGTATTFDVISQKGGYEGGIIAPGIEIMTRYLHEQTALLPLLKEEDLVAGPAIGKSTREAMRSGCLIGFTGMIQSLLESVKQSLIEQGELTPPHIILTGGSAGQLLASKLPQHHWNPLLTLQGLEYYFLQNS